MRQPYSRAYNFNICHAVFVARSMVRRWTWTLIAMERDVGRVERSVRAGFTRGWYVA